MAVDAVLKVSALRKGCDNITAVIIAFDHFESLIDREGALEDLEEEGLEEIEIPDVQEDGGE